MERKRVFIYVRVSTQHQAEEGYSIPQQIERLKKYCEAMGWILVKIYTDDGYSGGSLDRPAMNQMIKEIESGHADIVLVDKLDRLSRSQFDTLYMIQKVFDANGVAFVSRNEAFDTSTPFGKAMVGILAVFAELERSRIKERMMDGQEGRAKEGKYKGGGPIPTGYNYNKETGLLEINEYEAMQVREVFDLFINRMPIFTIMMHMNKKGYRTKYGEWKEQTIRGMVSRRIYIGEITYKGKVYEGQHEAIISLETFNKAQKVVAERAKENANRQIGKAYRSPLGGIIYCGNCGSRYHFRSGANNKDGTRRNYYTCYSRSKGDKKYIKDPNCKNKNYRDKELDAIIFEEIRKLKSEPAYIPAVRNSVDNSHKIEMIEKRIAQIDSQISRFMDLYSVGGMDMDAITGKVKPLNDEKKSLEAELETLEIPEAPMKEEAILELVDAFEIVVAEGDCNKIHAVVSTLIEKVVIDGEDIRIHWAF
jgi:site-specific DNA recombinase